MLAGVDWQHVLDTDVPTYIAALGAAVAAIIAALNRSAMKTPSGKSLGQLAEYAHDTAIANNMLLQAANGETKPAEPEQIATAGGEPPQVPANPPPTP